MKITETKVVPDFMPAGGNPYRQDAISVGCSAPLPGSRLHIMQTGVVRGGEEASMFRIIDMKTGQAIEIHVVLPKVGD